MFRADELIISAHGSHNASISMYYKGTYTVVEVERWTNVKNSGLTGYNPVRNIQLVFDEICDYLLGLTDRSDVDTYIAVHIGKWKPKFFYKKAITCDHHLSHAAGAFYQSPYQQALVFTFDGGGDGGFFNVYLANKGGGLTLLKKFNQDLGFAYMILADHLKDIKKEPLTTGNLVYAGKLMGLCSYGKVREEWLPHLAKFYETFTYTGDSYVGGAEARVPALTTLFKALGVSDFDPQESTYTGEFAWDLAATTQKAFELQFFKYADPYLSQYATLPICLSGGCALNVLLNSEILNRQKDSAVFVPPNTNDCGIAVGAILNYLSPPEPVDLTYAGIPILDSRQLCEYLEAGPYHVESSVTIPELAKYLAGNHIVGVIRGNSEHGSRALGNRSILCNPVDGMKDILNKKVKNREWYRPFAPMVKLQDANTYFDFPAGESRHMTFVAKVRPEWRSTLPAITHEDGTGRLQTVTRGQNPFIYELLTEFGKETGHSVLLNTSFNVNGKPILSRLSDAFQILDKTQLDALFYENMLIFRKGGEKAFQTIRAGSLPSGMKVDIHAVDVNFLVFEDKPDLKAYEKMLKTVKGHPGGRAYFIASEANAARLKKHLGDKIDVDAIGEGRLYHRPLVKKLTGKIDITMEDYASCLRPMWCKESLRETSRAYRQIIVDGPTTTPKMLTAALEAVQTFHGEKVMVTKDPKNMLRKPISDHYAKKIKLPTHGVPFKLLMGTRESVIATLDIYEAMFLYFMHNCQYVTQNQAYATELDFMTSAYLENPSKYLFIED